MRRPQKLPLGEIYKSLPDDIRQNKGRVSFRNGMGVVIGIDNSIFRYLKLASSPFLLEDYRMGMVMRGKLHALVNLHEYVMSEGTIVFVAPGTIVEPIEVSDDFLMEGMGLPADKFLMAHNGNLPGLFNGQARDGRKVIPCEGRMILDRMLRLLHDLMGRKDISEPVVYNMVSAITHYYDQQFHDETGILVSSHSGETFNRFLCLVNLHGCKEHQLSFYAEKLCITSRYLGALVLDTSGVRAKEWIDRAIISTAKVLLRHSNKQTAQIADELNFPNASFFCKYFKRLAGVTPQQYRHRVGG